MSRRSLKQPRGQGLVEFAILLLFLILLAFGIMDFARVFHTSVVLQNAAREGARYLTRHPDDTPGFTGTKNAAVNEAQSAGIIITSTNVTASCTDINLNTYCDGGSPAVVTVSFTFRTFMGSLFSVSNFPVTRSVQMVVP